MVITIEIGGKTADEEFTAAQLDLFHKECSGGRFDRRGDAGDNFWYLSCSRCHIRFPIHVGEWGTTSLIATAVDGEKRELQAPNKTDKIFAVRR